MYQKICCLAERGKERIAYIETVQLAHHHTLATMPQVLPLRLTPDRAKLLTNSELLRLSKELSEAYASKEKLVTDEALRVIGAMLWNSLDAGKQFAEAKRNAGQGILWVEAVVILAIEVNRYR
jgi:hypothetical protein